jgi:phosphoribosylformylglycinamidine cyclo-ligase
VSGDVLIGLPSAGLHTNGYSLARRVLFESAGFRADTFVPEIGAMLGDALLAPHRSYLRAMRPLLAQGLVKGMAHVTGGGITENLPRVLPEGTSASIDARAWEIPPLFRLIQQRGKISTDEMFRAFNMGIGLIVVAALDKIDDAIDLLERIGERPVSLGHVISGDRSVRYI